MQKKVLLSIKPEFAEKIFNESKKFEFSIKQKNPIAKFVRISE